MSLTPAPIDLSELAFLRLAEAPGAPPRRRAPDFAEDVFVYEAKDAVYSPKYGVQIIDGVIAEETINFRIHWELVEGWFRSLGDTVLDTSDLAVIEGPCCVLGYKFSHVFGHWTEELLRVVVLEQSGFEGRYMLRQGMPAFCRASLSAIGVGADRILEVDRDILVRTSVFTTTLHHFIANHYPSVFNRLRQLLHDASRNEAGLGPRIWVERGGESTGRNIVNHDEVMRCAERYGFVAVDFAKLPFTKQIAIGRDATLLAGAHGSAMVHCQFMADRGHVIEMFSPHYNNTSIIELCLVRQHRYNQIVAPHAPARPYAHGQDVLVDLNHLELVLSRVEAPPASRAFGGTLQKWFRS